MACIPPWQLRFWGCTCCSFSGSYLAPRSHGVVPYCGLHLGSLVWGILIEILPWTCPLTWAENWLETRAGIAPYQGGFMLHYLDALIYPNIPPGLLTGFGVAVCIVNLGIYARRFQRREVVGW